MNGERLKLEFETLDKSSIDRVFVSCEIGKKSTKTVQLSEFLETPNAPYHAVRRVERNNSGFRGGVNYYRNFDSNWLITEAVDPVISMPSAFVSGAQDVVIQGADTAALKAMMSPVMQQLGDITLIDGMGHWIQQEAPAETNAAIIQFLKSI